MSSEAICNRRRSRAQCVGLNGTRQILSGIRGKARVGIFCAVSIVAVIPDWLHARESMAGHYLHRRMV